MILTTGLRPAAAAALLVLLGACGGGTDDPAAREAPAAVAASVDVTFVTVPPGLQLLVNGEPVTTPHILSGPPGREHQVYAPTQNAAGQRQVFRYWNDGGPQGHPVALPGGPTTWVASFGSGGAASGQPPQVTLTAPSTGRAGTPLALGATATDANGVSSVEFFVDGKRVATDTAAPYAGSWTPPAAGSYRLTARATDALRLVTVSTPLTVAVATPSAADPVAPQVNLTAPANLATGLAGIVALTATASDNVGVAEVIFQVDGQPVGIDSTPPYRVDVNSTRWTTGQHVVRAAARDAAGNQSAWDTATVELGGNRNVPVDFAMNGTWVSGLSSATAFARSPDGRYLFIAQQGGALRLVKDGVLQATPFLTLPVDANGERGLIGVAVHPNFASTGWVYVHYTSTQGGTHNRVSRFTSAGDTALPGSEQVLIDLPVLSSATNHNGGALHFGLDGKLYVAVGDNGNGAKAQNLADPFGKLLRLNPSGSIPSDNPFYATQAGLARAVWAYGLRNPFTFAFQPASGRLFINDVGGTLWEEIDRGSPGANYGWPDSEGPDGIEPGLTPPLFAYGHEDTSPRGSGPGGFFTGFAIAGGAFYPGGGNFPARYKGSYFFADFVGRFVGRLDLANGNAAYAFARLPSLPVDLLVGADGAIYALMRSGVARIAYQP